VDDTEQFPRRVMGQPGGLASVTGRHQHVADRSAAVLVWLLPFVALALVLACAAASSIASVHFCRVDAAFPDDGRGILRGNPIEVSRASRILGLTWMAALPVAGVATLMSAAAQDRFRAEGVARLFAQFVTVVGVAGCVGGAVLAMLGFVAVLM